MLDYRTSLTREFTLGVAPAPQLEPASPPNEGRSDDDFEPWSARGTLGVALQHKIHCFR